MYHIESRAGKCLLRGHWGLSLNLKDAQKERENNVLKETKGDAGGVHCLLQLSSLSRLAAMSSVRIIFHLMCFMSPKELFGSLVSLFIGGLGIPPKLKTDTVSSSPVTYQFLRCSPPGLDQSVR
uniref:Uncharacterized protein n=1 Tax=Molossus molossus TaxID=27622 RepID=A0A7J8I1X0_MOLMO|nr:hypothetical protein HJG59_010844 [Molossus molossus]